LFNNCKVSDKPRKWKREARLLTEKRAESDREIAKGSKRKLVLDPDSSEDGAKKMTKIDISVEAANQPRRSQ
jgi:hypothetical protein